MKGLKTVLWVTAIGCLTAVPFIFLPWTAVESIMSLFGVESLPNVPIVIYSFKVTFSVYGLIGIYFIILAREPLKYGPMLNLSAFGLIVFGLSALVLGLSNGLSPIIYLGDGLSGVILGSAIFVFSSKPK